ncbi:MAG TPA: hypothetical protein VF331_01885 [Polyangiales bacterium]
MTEPNPSAPHAAIRKRAADARQFAKRGVTGIVVVVLVMIVGFNLAMSTKPPSSTGPEARPISAMDLVRTESEAAAAPVGVPAQSKHLDDVMKAAIKDMNTGAQSMEKFARAMQWALVASTIARIGSVILAIYLVQILVSFTRYHFRIADHLDAVADAIDIAGCDPSKIVALAAVLTPHAIEFGKAPVTPIESVLGTIRDLASKIPEKK